MKSIYMYEMYMYRNSTYYLVIDMNIEYSLASSRSPVHTVPTSLFMNSLKQTLKPYCTIKHVISYSTLLHTFCEAITPKACFPRNGCPERMHPIYFFNHLLWKKKQFMFFYIVVWTYLTVLVSAKLTRRESLRPFPWFCAFTSRSLSALRGGDFPPDFKIC